MAVLGGNARLGIPKINPSPRPPGIKTALANHIAAKPRQPRIGVGNNVAAPKGLQQGLAGNTVVTPAPAAPAPTAPATVPATQTTPTDPFQSVVNPTGHFQVPTWTPQKPGEADPRDSTYWEHVTKLQGVDNPKYAEIEQAKTASDANYAQATQEAIHNHVLQERALGLSSISGGLESSGWLDRNQANQTTAYTNERSNASLTKSQEDQAFTTAIGALEEGWGIETAAELAAAGGRYTEHQGKEAGEGAPEGSAAPPGAATPPASNNKNNNNKNNKGNGSGGTSAPKADAPKNHFKIALGKARKAK
jgi:hypothetical protein